MIAGQPPMAKTDDLAFKAFGILVKVEGKSTAVMRAWFRITLFACAASGPDPGLDASALNPCAHDSRRKHRLHNWRANSWADRARWLPGLILCPA
jgi:hypothetical protein